MEHVGIDLHKRESQVCILTREGEVEEVRIATARERFHAGPGQRPRVRLSIEASTESEWVARYLEGVAHRRPWFSVQRRLPWPAPKPTR